jgi:hypothetical protein
MASTDTMRTVYVAKRNGQCQHCGHRFFSSEPNPAPLCYHCESAGRTVEVYESFKSANVEIFDISPSALYALASESTPEEVPDFDSYDDFATYDADDLRDAALERELDEHGVAS